MGAWSFVEPNLEWVLERIESQASSGRATPAAGSAATATGLMSKHQQEQKTLASNEAPGSSDEAEGKRTGMAIEIRVPALGEAVTEATVGKWFKSRGDAVKADEPLVELETDKVDGRSAGARRRRAGRDRGEAGATVAVGAVLGAIKEGAAATRAARRQPRRQPQSLRPARRSAQGAARQHAGRSGSRALQPATCRPPAARKIDARRAGSSVGDIAGIGPARPGPEGGRRSRGVSAKRRARRQRRRTAPAAPSTKCR